MKLKIHEHAHLKTFSLTKVLKFSTIFQLSINSLKNTALERKLFYAHLENIFFRNKWLDF